MIKVRPKRIKREFTVGVWMVQLCARVSKEHKQRPWSEKGQGTFQEQRKGQCGYSVVNKVVVMEDYAGKAAAQYNARSHEPC